MSKNDRLPTPLSRAPKVMSTLDWKPGANDVIIPLMGRTGAGKSKFVNFIAGKEVTTVGHDLQRCTVKLLPVVIDFLRNDLLTNGRLVLLDAPGFGDSYVDDHDVILRGIGTWLETMYDSRDSHGLKGETKLAGIVYLYDISSTRTLGPTLRNFDVFQKLCGEDALKRVVLCTTKWSDIIPEEGEKRTEQLKETYWKKMIEGGSTVREFEDSQKSAWDVIAPIIEEKENILSRSSNYMKQNNRRYNLPKALLSLFSRNTKAMPTLDWKPEANDVIIPLLGPIGAGKSTFINFVAGKEVTTVSGDLKSCTMQLLPVVIGSLQRPFPNYGRLVVVDAPGFHDAYDDADTLHRIGVWLETMYDSRDSHGRKGETKLAGIVYLHDISPTHRPGSALKTLDVFRKLCGEDALKRVVLCTTKWSDIIPEEGEKRTEQLKKIYWKEMIEGGSTVCKFEDSRKSAWDVIAPIIEGHQNEKNGCSSITKGAGGIQETHQQR
ncbi:uncharacterized protein LACBIDRAFT_302488 [Laccaria bicolor S238N-H82]|uniref:Predicted protein n=1 Tax=Laccaria bicolor (strain S238N-H82 / ATCC MYA-4686) TaxID=486041 RepID=B0DHR7_LACBS|nr:uncharacterized protein LACBIDRAFT_302488 [Laccaria bicolor S238N-H82]EDR05775.1 predicted protein [Laccaria bicolor S238N-H82]|eukprot:XP_001883451.1 predicted protein [Laccaria bicolor S238N-H82]